MQLFSVGDHGPPWPPIRVTYVYKCTKITASIKTEKNFGIWMIHNNGVPKLSGLVGHTAEKKVKGKKKSPLFYNGNNGWSASTKF